jgi:hypothetical protein
VQQAVRGAGHHRQLGVRDRPVGRDRVLEGDLVIVADHDERPPRDAREILGPHRRLVEVQPGQLGVDQEPLST